MVKRTSKKKIHPKGEICAQKLVKATAELFLEKGVARTSVRDIAGRSDINLALISYYFGNKENLSKKAFSALIKKYTVGQIEVLDSDLPLREKIIKFVDTSFDLLTKNPFLVAFVVEMVQWSKDRVTTIEEIHKLYVTDKFAQQISEEIEKGNIRPVHPSQIFIDIQSLISFPFAIRPLIKDKLQVGNQGLNEFFEERRKYIPEMIMAYLKP